jgi:hypothetical protein
LAAYYATVFLAALVSFASVQLGWQPMFATIWDGRAIEYVNIACFLLMLFSALGLGALAPVQKWPKRLRAMPLMVAMCSAAFLSQSMLNLTPGMLADEIFVVVGRGLGFGVATGIFMGFLAGLSPESEQDRLANAKANPTRAHAIFASALVAISLGCLAILMIPRDRDDGKVESIGRFDGAQGQLVLSVASAPLTSEPFGVVQITAHGAIAALVLEPREWDEFVAITSKAEGAQSPNWRVIGEIHDTGPGEITHLTVSAGPGMRFVANSPHGPNISYDLSRADIPRFSGTIGSVTRKLHK